jgi:hypothetical protein
MARRKTTAAERAALQAWIDVAQAKAGEPLPDAAFTLLRDLAAAVARLAMSAVPPTKAAKHAATLAGLTGVAIADFRREQKDLLTTMCLDFNKYSEHRVGLGKVEHHIAANVSDVSARQAFRRRQRVLRPKNRQ